DDSTLPAHPRIGGVTTSSHVLEYWKAEPQSVGKGADLWRECARGDRVQHLLNAAREEGVLVLKVRVECRATDVRTFQDLVDRDGGIALLVNQRHDRLVQSPLSPPHPRIVHLTGCHKCLLLAEKTNKPTRCVR